MQSQGGKSHSSCEAVCTGEDGDDGRQVRGKEGEIGRDGVSA